MERSDINPMPVYFDRYINQVDDIELNDALQQSLAELDGMPLEHWRAVGHQPIAEGKWTVNDTLQHLIDTERVFSYRALAFARGEQERLTSFDEAAYADVSQANQRDVADLIAELKAVRQSFIHLVASFTDEMLQRSGHGFKGEYSVLSIGFTMPGHQRHHFKILAERYGR
jgi:uncharacterized damage-inducible protein DinB